MNAKFLWKRLPQSLKATAIQNQTELFKIWCLAQHMIQRQYSEAFSLFEQFKISGFVWSSDLLANLIEKLVKKTRDILFDTVNTAYSSISIQELASLLNLNVENVVKITTERGWLLDDSGFFLIPNKKSKN
jgi:hypothetical protein